MTIRQVTENDFRQPIYKDAKVEDYEFRADGQLVRKDRWETAIHEISWLMDKSTREFEIDDIVNAVKTLAETQPDWLPISEMDDDEDFPANQESVMIRLTDGSILKNCKYNAINNSWTWYTNNYTNAQVNAWCSTN